MARMFTQQELDAALTAQRKQLEEQLEERFDVERAFLIRLVDMLAHKNAQYEEVITTMSAEIMRTSRRGDCRSQAIVGSLS